MMMPRKQISITSRRILKEGPQRGYYNLSTRVFRTYEEWALCDSAYDSDFSNIYSNRYDKLQDIIHNIHLIEVYAKNDNHDLYKHDKLFIILDAHLSAKKDSI